MSKTIKLNKGLDIKLKGHAELCFGEAEIAETYALKPTDFFGLTPKLAVKEGDSVKAGAPLFFDKNHPEIKFVSSVSGIVTEVARGEKRKLLHIAVKADENQEYVQHNVGELEKMNRDEILNLMLEAGVFPFFIQRPYGIIANPTDNPKAIFVSCFDSAPLAFDFDFAMKNDAEAFQKGINVLSNFLGKPVNIGISDKQSAGSFFQKTQNATVTTFQGKHPAGNVGVQINHTCPINKGEIVWTIKPQHVAIIGKLFTKGIYDASTALVLAGTGVEKPCYYKTLIGAPVFSFVRKIKDGDNRIISGNVLCGTKVDAKNYVGFYDNQLCVIPEGDHFEMFGWAKPFRTKKFSLSRSYFSWLCPSKKYDLDTNINGSERAFVMNGEYEKVLPMDILPVYLLKAILANDIDKMEQLGIYEVIEEDLALCEFVCTSKIEVQRILREGINTMIKEM